MNKSAAKQSGAMDEKKKRRERKESAKNCFFATEVCDRSMRVAQLPVDS
jgi:hypothetical protein